MKKRKQFSFYKRSAVCFTVIAALFAFSVARIGIICSDESLKEAAQTESTYKLGLYRARGEIYDTKMRPLTDISYKRMCVLPPNDEGLAAANKLLSGDDLSETTERLISGYPVTVPLNDGELPYGALLYFEPIRYGIDSLSHILGYLDKDGHGVTGIEKEFDGILYSGKKTTADFTVTATGKILPNGESGINEVKSTSSVCLTVDRDIEMITEQAMSEVKKGAAIVVEAATGKIRASVSKPYYNGNDVGDLMNTSDGVLVNRALVNYNVGSVFKLLVSAAALDSGLPEISYLCNGYYNAGERNFSCHEKSGHGIMNMKTAIAESCNVYFYNLTNKMSVEPILKAAYKCGFDTSLYLTDTIKTEKGIISELSELDSVGAKCNFAIGQGKTMLSLVAVSNLFCAIVNGGIYNDPYLVESVRGEEGKNYKSKSSVRVMSVSAADTLKEYLSYAVNNGTGTNAKPKNKCEGVGGKTATAQTGWIENGERVSNGWYCGYLTVNGTDYVICTVREQVYSGASDCAPIFRKIADGIIELYSK